MSEALAQARRISHQRRRIAEASLSIHHSLGLHETLQAIATELGKVARADYVQIRLDDLPTFEYDTLTASPGAAGSEATTGPAPTRQERRADAIGLRWASALPRTLSAPLLGNEKRGLGVIEIVNHGEKGFTPADEAALAQIARFAAVAIRNARRYEQSQRELQERRRVEESWHRSEGELKAVIDALPDAVTVVDFEGILVDINTATLALLQTPSREAVLGTSVYEWIVPEHREMVEAFNTAIHSGAVSTAQFDVVGSDRVRHHLQCRAVPVWRRDVRATCSLAISRDVTAERQAEATLREQNARYQLQAQLLDAVGQAVIATHLDGTIFYWNRAAENLYGWTSEEAIGRQIIDVTPAKTSKEQAHQIMEQLRQGEVWAGEFPVRHRSGRTFSAWVTSTIIRGDQGEATGIIGTCLDLTEQKRTEQALSESEIRFRRLSEANIIGTFFWNASGEIFDANDAFLEMLGYTRTDLERDVLDWRALTPPEFTELDARLEKELRLRGAIRPYEKEFWRKDGSRVPVLLGAATLDGGKDQGVGYVLDLTERKQAEKTQQETLNILQAVTEGTTDAVFVKDRQGRYLMINSAGARFMGRSVEDVIGRHDTEFFSPDTVGRVLESDARALHQGETFTTEEAITAQGVARIYQATKGPFRDPSGNIIGVVGVSRDITSQKADEQALRESEARFRAIADAFPHGIFLTDPNGSPVYVNAQGRRQAGIEPDELLTEGWRRALHPDDRQRVISDWHLALTTQGRLDSSHRFLHRDGKVVWIRARTEPLWVNGAFLGYVGMTEDVTQVRHLEEQLRQAQKMEAIGRMAGGIAHDFNNMLAVINGYSEIVQMCLPPDSPLSDHLGEVRKAGDRAAGLTRQLLAFSRKQVLAPKVLDPNDLIIELKKMLSRLIGEDIRLEEVLQPDVGTVFADPGQLEQVLLNLAVNARDAMPQGGTLRLETRNVTLADEDLDAADDLFSTDYVALEVRDSGSGIPPEVKARIFEPFFTTKQLGEGTGLGLAVAHGIVAQSGGRIDVESQVGVGTTFRILLPRCEAPAQALAFGSPAPTIPLGSETVLVVEDEEAVRLLSCLVLRDAGYQVLDAQDAKEALELVAKHPSKIDILVTDVVLPGMGGRHLAQELQQRDPTLDVLYLSGYLDDAVVRHGVLVNEVNFLQKPFSLTELACKVRSVLDTRNELEFSGEARR